MKKKRFFLFLGLFSLLVQPAFAQEKIIAKIKKDMTDLAQKNFELKKRYEKEVQAVYAYEEKVNAKKKELSVFEANYQKKQAKIDKRKDNLKYLYKKMDAVQSDILIQKGKNSFLKKKLLEKQKEFDLLNLQLADVKTQKKDLQSNLNDVSFETQKAEKGLNRQLVSLRMKLNTNIDKQKGLSELIVTIEENLLSSEQKKQVLMHEKQRFQGQLQELRQKKDIQTRENLILSDKLLLAQKNLEGEISIRAEEKEQLMDVVNGIETEYNDFTQKIEEAIKWKVKKDQYHKEMVDLDRENTILRKKVLELRKKLEKLQR